MAEPSIGEAISLQGQTNNTLRLAQSAGQAFARKAAVDEKKQARKDLEDQKQQEDIKGLFRERGKLHPLVLGEMDKIFDQTLTDMEKIKSSENPYASNQYAQIERNLRGKLIELTSYSRQLDGFDQQIKFRDEKRKYYGDAISPFLETYRKATSLDDLKKFANENPDFQDANFRIDPNGIPTLAEETALPITEDLARAAKNLNSVIQYRDVVSVPGLSATKELRDVMGKPLYKDDAKRAFQNNPQLYPDGKPPKSLEDEVDDYMILYGEDVIRQASTKFNLGIKRGPQGYTEQDKKKVTDALVLYMSQFSNPELKGKLAQDRQGTNIYMPDNAASPGDISVGLEALDLKTPGDLVDNVKIAENQKTPKKAESLASIVVGTPDAFVQASDQVTDEFGNKLTGNFTGEITAVRLMPYKLVNGVKVIARYDDASKIAGVAPFVQFNNKSSQYYTTLANYANPAAFAGTKYKAGEWTKIFMQFYKLQDKVNNAMSGKKFKTQQEFNTFAQPLLTLPK